MNEIDPKPKNDEKPKGRPRRHRAVIVGLFSLFAITLSGVVWRVLSYPNVAQPTGQIFYSRDEMPMVVNLQTGERKHADGIYHALHQAILGLSPDEKWHLNWVEVNPGDKTYTYSLEITNTETHIAHTVGPIHGYNYASGAVWSPDSQGIYFTAYPDPYTREDSDGHNGELWRVDMATLQLIRLTNNTSIEHSMQVSPDSAKLAYIAAPDGYSRLHILDVATGQSIIPAPDMYIFFGSWSPDSQWFAFETNHANGISDIWITRADGTETQGIALDPNAWEGGPIWKP